MSSDREFGNIEGRLARAERDIVDMRTDMRELAEEFKDYRHRVADPIQTALSLSQTNARTMEAEVIPFVRRTQRMEYQILGGWKAFALLGYAVMNMAALIALLFKH